MAKDVNTEQVVTAPEDLNNVDVVNQQDLTDSVVENQDQGVLADGTSANKDVPYIRLQEEAKKRKEAEEKASYAERRIEMMEMQASQQQPVQQQAPKSVSQQALDSLNLTADDLYGENIVRYQEAVSTIDNAQRQQSNAVMQTQQFMMTHSDLNSVVGSVNPTTGQIMQPTAELMALVAKKQYLAKASTQDLYAAVLDERKFTEYQKTAAIQEEHQIRTGVAAATQPIGGSAAGSGGSGSQGGQMLHSREATLQIERDIAAGKYS